MKINDIPPSDYNKLPIDEQMEILKDIPIGSYIHLTYNNSPTMKKDDNESETDKKSTKSTSRKSTKINKSKSPAVKKLTAK